MVSEFSTLNDQKKKIQPTRWFWDEVMNTTMQPGHSLWQQIQLSTGLSRKPARSVQWQVHSNERIGAGNL